MKLRIGHKARLGLATLGALIVLVVVFGAGIAVESYSNSKPAETALKTSKVSQIETKPLTTTDINVPQLLSLTNHARSLAGVTPLRLNSALNASATAKCSDMVKQNYWSHYAPDGTSPWQYITAQGIPEIHLGENLAVGDESAQQTVNGWMESTEHRHNILDAQFTDVGFAVCKSDDFVSGGPKLIIVQHFADL